MLNLSPRISLAKNQRLPWHNVVLYNYSQCKHYSSCDLNIGCVATDVELTGQIVLP